jgi:hypothetical protein
MNREKVKTVGFSLLAQPGLFNLEIDYIKAVNTEETEGILVKAKFAKFLFMSTFSRQKTGDWPRMTKLKKEKAQIETETMT